MPAPRRSTEPVRSCRRRGIAFGRGRHPAAFVPLNYWRHLLAYFALAGSLAYAIDDWDFDRWKQAVLVIPITASYGIAMEAGQQFLPHRTPFLLTDAAVNTLDASGGVVWYLVRPSLELKPVTEFFE